MTRRSFASSDDEDDLTSPSSCFHKSCLIMIQGGFCKLAKCVYYGSVCAPVQVLKISLIGHRKRILASLGDRLHEDTPQKPPRAISLRVSVSRVPARGLPAFPPARPPLPTPPDRLSALCAGARRPSHSPSAQPGGVRGGGGPGRLPGRAAPHHAGGRAAAPAQQRQLLRRRAAIQTGAADGPSQHGG